MYKIYSIEKTTADFALNEEMQPFKMNFCSLDNYVFVNVDVDNKLHENDNTSYFAHVKKVNRGLS